MSSEVGNGHVAIVPSLKGFRKVVSTEVDGAVAEGGRRFRKGFTRAGSDAGRGAGKGFKAAFGSSTRDFSSAALKTINKDIASASKALSTARLKEQDAAGKVRIAETKLTEARAKGASGSSRVVAAEERLATAHRKLGATQGTVKTSTDSLASAQAKLAAVTAAASAAANTSRGRFGGFLSSMGSGFRGVANVVGTVGSAIGRGLVSALSIAARAFVTTAKVGIGAFTGLIALVGGLAVKGGLTRLLNIEDAQAKLKGLGNSTETVTTIMSNALESVKGTFFTLDDAATVAASAVAAGIKPGKDLTKYLKLTADAASIAGGSLGDMGAIINKTTTSGHVFTDDLNQLADKGLPIFTWLQTEYGVSADKLRDMVQSGEIDSARFRKAIEDNIGGAALSAGNTTRGAFANMKAAMSRTGAALLTTILPQFQGFFTKVGSFFDAITPKAAEFGKKLNGPIDSFLNGTLRVLKALGDISKMDGGFSFKNIRTQFEGAFPGMDGVFDVLAALKPILPELAKAFKETAPSLEKLIPQLADLAVKILPVLVQLIPAVTKALGGISAFAATVTLPIWSFVLDPKLWEDFWNFGDPESEGRMTDRMQSGVFGPVIAQFGSFTADWDKGWDSFWAGVGTTASNGAKQITDFVAGIPSMVLLALGDLGATFVTSGQNLIQGFLDGIDSMFPGLRKTLGRVMDFVKGFFPHSPAERGPFSGAGWTAIGRSGSAIIDQFNRGFPDATVKFSSAVAQGVSPCSPPTRG